MVSDAQILSEAFKVIEDTLVGVLTTVSEDGEPHSRYMAAAVEDKTLSRLFSLSAKETCKIDHLAHNPKVCWSFTTPKFSQIVTLYGEAQTVNTTSLPMSAWNQLIKITEPYDLNQLRSEGHHAFCGIVTQVQAIEYLHPAQGIVTPQRIKVS